MLTRLLEKYLPDSKITEFWKNPRKRGIVLLTFWTAFIIFVFWYFVIPYNNEMKKMNEYAENLASEEPNEKTDKEKSIEDKWQELLDSDYEYKMVVYKGEEITTYEGIKVASEVTGTKSDANGEQEYFIQDEMVYLVQNEEATEYDTLLNIEYDIYLNPKYIYRKIKDLEPTITENRYIYEKDKDCVIISVGDYINSIEVDLENTKYILQFNRID